ncbi:YutD-like domain-containing protein [Paenibacillus thermotolerans]|uniref:YutD-like domain-containing protein n=1 Tax=Paenibacillus thermotolerans TaxID=3027807 RepID=UPI002368244D|nr:MULTISPECIES: YutD-like domain-containing protein [unclassified Paenibacillus]
MIFVGGKTYELIKEHKNAWNPDAFKERYSEVLDRYDYIVGDWGYNQLRLKGFFREGSPKANKETSVSGLQDYLQEYCNFGCAYFVLERVNAKSGAHAHGEEHEHAGAGQPAAADGAEHEAEPETPAEAKSAPSLIAGGHPFSDRRPYSWREHQSPVRSPGRAAAERKEAQGEADPAAGAKKPGGGFEPRSREDAVRVHGGQQGGKGRQGQAGGATNRGERGFAQGVDGVERTVDKGQRGEGRRFHPKGPKQAHGGRGQQRGGGPKHAGGAPRAEGGARPDGRNRQHEGAERPAQRGRNHHVQQPHTRNPE